MIEVNRSDWIRTPGRNAMLSLGPFGCFVDTADGWAVAFSIKLGRYHWSWMLTNNGELE